MSSTIKQKRANIAKWMKKEGIPGKRMTQKKWDKLSLKQIDGYHKAAGHVIIKLV